VNSELQLFRERSPDVFHDGRSSCEAYSVHRDKGMRAREAVRSLGWPVRSRESNRREIHVPGTRQRTNPQVQMICQTDGTVQAAKAAPMTENRDFRRRQKVRRLCIMFHTSRLLDPCLPRGDGPVLRRKGFSKHVQTSI